MTLNWAIFADSVHDNRLKDDLRDGLKAAVELYYREYTQATELEPGFYRSLTKVLESLFDSDLDTEWLHTLINEVHETLTGTLDCDNNIRPAFTAYAVESDDED